MAHLPHVGQQAKALPLAALVLILSASVATEPAFAQATGAVSAVTSVDRFDRHIAIAAQRSGLPAHWIHAVIEVESAGNPRAVSRAGALGLMQIMPATWAELRAAHGLGDDPFDPRDNILAGAAYLRQMYDRFASPGFLAAYNAGPVRYEEFIATGRPLPRETRDYLAVLAPIIRDGPVPERKVNCTQPTLDWREAALFATTAEEAQAECDEVRHMASEAAQRGIFVPLSREQRP